jgi:transcriptional regulator with XRE-family HTH domain
VVNLSERIRKVIKKSDLSLQEFGARLGVARNTIVSYRDGATSPPVEFLEKMAAEFEVGRAWLILGEEPDSRERAPEVTRELTFKVRVGISVVEDAQDVHIHVAASDPGSLARQLLSSDSALRKLCRHGPGPAPAPKS